MSTVATNELQQKIKPKKAKKAPGKEGPGKSHKFSQIETATWGMICTKFELANEKEKSGRDIRQSAQMLQQSWLQGIMKRCSIPEDARMNVNTEEGTITVMGVQS